MKCSAFALHCMWCSAYLVNRNILQHCIVLSGRQAVHWKVVQKVQCFNWQCIAMVLARVLHWEVVKKVQCSTLMRVREASQLQLPDYRHDICQNFNRPEFLGPKFYTKRVSGKNGKFATKQRNATKHTKFYTVCVKFTQYVWLKLIITHVV